VALHAPFEQTSPAAHDDSASQSRQASLSACPHLRSVAVLVHITSPSLHSSTQVSLHVPSEHDSPAAHSVRFVQARQPS
jgi:hypothetical protein